MGGADLDVIIGLKHILTWSLFTDVIIWSTTLAWKSTMILHFSFLSHSSKKGQMCALFGTPFLIHYRTQIINSLTFMMWGSHPHENWIDATNHWLFQGGKKKKKKGSDHGLFGWKVNSKTPFSKDMKWRETCFIPL